MFSLSNHALWAYHPGGSAARFRLVWVGDTVRSRCFIPMLVAISAGALAPRSAESAWLSNGRPVALGDSVQSSPVVAADGSGGAFIAWQDYRSGRWVVYVQRLTADGVPAPNWPLGG